MPGLPQHLSHPDPRDRFGRKTLLVIGFVGYIIVTPTTLFLAGLGNFTLACIATSFSALPFVIVQAVAYPLYPELFPARVRYTGISVAFNIATILGGGTAPYVATLLTSITGNKLAPAFYVVAATLVGLAALATVRETANRRLAV